MSVSTLANLNGAAPSAQDWLQQSVQEFFSGINWENSPPAVYELSQELTTSVLQGTDVSLSMSLTVSQFFAAIPWDGATIAVTPLPAKPAEPEDVNSLTLEGFSDLFG